MENRFSLLGRCLLIWMFSSLLFASKVNAQLDFTFSYNGPDTLFVDESCTAILDWGAPGSISADCNNMGCTITVFEILNISGGYMEGDSVPAGANPLITYYVEDNQGNDAFFGFSISIVDTIKPLFDSTTLPLSLDVTCLTQVPNPPDLADIVATDNCPPVDSPFIEVTIIYEGQSNNILPCEAGTFTRTWTATDEFGNSTEYVQMVTVDEDITPPTITGFPVSLTTTCELADYDTWIADQRAAFTATDDGCGIAAILDDAPDMFDSSCDSVIVTFTAVDGCGLDTTVVVKYIVTDGEGPIITPPLVTDITLECADVLNDPLTQIINWSDNLTATDNCDMIIWDNDFVALTGGCGGTTGRATVTYTASDDCGHESMIMLNFTVEDSTPPLIEIAPADEMIVCNGMGNGTELTTWLNNLGGAVVSDACTDINDITLGLTLDGNSATAAQIQDTLDARLLNSCTASVMVGFSFTDVCNNASAATATFTVSDTEAPVWTSFPTDEEIECDGSMDPMGSIAAWLAANGNGIAEDNCGNGVNYSNDYTGLSDDCGATGTALVTFTATDDCGNTASQTANVSIVDNTPTIWDVLPEDLNIDCDASVDPTPIINAWLMANGNGLASDACSGGMLNYTNDYMGLTVGCGATGSATVIFTVTDDCGRTINATTSINIVDTIPPVWNDIPDDLTLPCDTTTSADLAIADWLNNNGNGSASDACSDSVVITHDYTGLTNGCGGNTGTATVTFTATDACGNTSQQAANVGIVDNVAPVWDTDPTDLLLNCDGLTDIAAEINTWLMANGNGSASDLCGDVFIANDYNGAEPGCTPMEAVIVNFTATDGCLNPAIRSATIMIVDADPPTIDVMATDITVDCDTSLLSFAEWVNTHGGAEASDDCYTIDNADGSTDWIATPMAAVTGCGGEYTREVTFTVSDNCGNTSQTTATYTVEDNTGPIFTTPPMDMDESCDGDDQTALENWIDAYGSAVITDGCGTAFWLEFDYTTSDGSFNTNVPFGTYVLYPDVLGHDCNWSVSVTFRMVDDCSQSNEATATFSIFDSSDPVLVGVPVDEVIDCNTTASSPTVTTTDNCDLMVDLVMTADTVPGTCPVLEVITRTWTAIDDCGNEVRDTQTITIEDMDDPVLVGVPANTTANCEKLPKVETVTATDGCDANPIVTVNETDNRPNDGSCADYNYTITRTWTATDACGNTATGAQEIIVSDNDAPSFTAPADITLSCDQLTDPTVAGQVSDLLDNCDPNPLADFIDVRTNTGCGNSYILTRTWTATDACGNTSSGQDQIITVTDFDDPIIVQTAQDMEIDCVDDATVEAAFLVWLNNYGSASGIDNCTITDDLTWFAAVPGSYDLNNPVTFPGTSPGTLDTGICSTTTMGLIRSELVDFVVYDECENAVAVSATFSVIDTMPPVFDDCPIDLTITADPGLCEALVTLEVPTVSDACGVANDLVISYAINGLPPVLWTPFVPLNVTLPEGTSTISYIAVDCAGNQDTCDYTITVADQEAPQITCPADTILSLDPMLDCSVGVTVTLPLPSGIDDNCAYTAFTQTQPFDLADALLTFTYDSAYQNYIADDKAFNFIATAANAVNNSVAFTVRVEGDVEDAEEYFTVYGEDGSVLGTTEASQVYVDLTPGNCGVMPVQHGVAVATLSVPVSDYNTWAADGIVTITAVSNTTFSLPAPGGADDGINPSCMTFTPGTPNGQTDGASNITIQLDVNTATPYFYTNGATNWPNTDMLPPVIAPTLTFAAGETNVFYVIRDLAGNEDTCSFMVTVEDITPPVANCQSTTLFVNPSGQIDYILDPLEINNGSTDNCGIMSYSISPDTFNCNQAGSSVMVTLTVTDVSGNTATCDATVAVETEAPMPSYSIGLCGNDTLYLFANPPASTGGLVYTYLWSGPNGFLSTLENPFIPNVTSTNSGTYSVVVEGLTGCTALGTVEILITDTPNTPVISVNSNMLCTTEDLVLTTTQYSGSVVNYHWYAGIYPGGTFIATTGIPTHTIFAPLAPVTNTYFVIVEVDGCASDASFFATVEVTDAPIASTNDALLQLCEGETFTLGTSVTGPGFTYSWMGPNGFNSDQANPPAFTNASTLEAGVYTLVISANGCPSSAANTLVNVSIQPAQPVISSPGLVCAGDSVTFTTNVTGADLYGWMAPDFSINNTTTNSYTIPAAALSDEGEWRVFVNVDGCNSENSFPVMLFVEPPLNIIATNDGPVCEGTTLQLSANTIPGASYIWDGPNSFISVMQNPVIDAISGTYSVTVTASSGCTNVATTDVLVNIVPTIDSITNSAPPCVTGLEDITLNVDLSPADPGNYSYQWMGPGGFISISNPAIIPNATVDDNGAYIVVVTSNEGCVSLPMETTINVSNAPAPPMISGNTIFCEGETILLTTAGASGLDVVYYWDTPIGQDTTSVPSLIIDNTNPLDSGTYQVTVLVDGCLSNLSPEFTIDVNPNPATPIVTADDIVCMGSTIELETDFIPGATYIWTGPSGFGASVYNPIIFDATEDNEGAYAVQIIVDGCASMVSAPIYVQVNEATAVPTALNDGPLCIDAIGSSLLLSVSSSTATPGATYTWYDATTNQIIAGPSAALTALINDFSAYGEGTFDFYVIAEVNGCASPASVPTSVEMNAVPGIVAFAGDPITVCNANSAALNAEAPTIGLGMWTQISGPAANIANPTAANTIVSNLQSDEVYTFQWTLSNGACTDYSFDAVTVTVDGISEQADAGLNLELCNTTEATLGANPSLFGATGIWSQTPEQQAEGVVIDDPTDPNTGVSGLSPGEVYEFTWTLSNPGCGEFSSASILVMVEENTMAAYAGLDFDACTDGVVQLAADTPISGQGIWTTSEPDLTINQPNNPTTSVEGFVAGGTYTFTWTLDNGICGLSTDEVVISFESAPVAADDLFTVPFGSTEEINVKDNDEINAPFNLVISELPEHGQLSVLAPGEFVFAADPTYAGIDTFTYVICSEACPTICSTAKVTLMIGSNADCDVPSIFTPNDDLVNDYFIIPCLATEEYPNNVVSIFNQWGDEIFIASPYNNDWQGTHKGEALPVGTYYYIIEFGQGQAPASGFLVLER